MNNNNLNQDGLIELSVIVPVFNELENVQNLFQEVVAALDKKHFLYEVIFVDDASNDGTTAHLQNLALTNPELRLIAHKRNAGQSAALLTGAKAARFPLLVTMDGDGQNDPEDIPRMVEEHTGADCIVLGNRTKRDDNWLRKISSRIGNSVRQGLLKDGCPDTGCSLKVFSRDAFLQLPHFNHMHRFLPALFKHAGFTLVNVPVNHRARQFGTSKYGVMNRLFVGIHDLIGVRWLIKRKCLVEVMNNDA